MKIGIILMAAGRGQRFIDSGGLCHKLNAQLHGTSVFEHSLRHAISSGLQVHIITRPDNSVIQHLCHAYQVPVILTASEGLSDSIAAGVRATMGWDGWLIHLADLPFVPSTVFQQVAAHLTSYPLVRPRINLKPGHPVGFSATWGEKLSQLSGDNGAKELLRDKIIHYIDFNDADYLRDIDVVTQLSSARENNAIY